MTVRKIIKRLHLYIALALCLPLVLQGLSGSILVVERKLSEPQLLSDYSSVRPISAIISAAKKEVPEGFEPGIIRFAEVSEIRFSKKTEQKNETLAVKINPTSLEIISVKNPQTGLLYQIQKFHTNLLIQGPQGTNIGRKIIGYYGLVMLFMIISGIIIWWPKKGNLQRAVTFKFSSSGKKFHRDLHGAIGFWMALLMLASIFAGVYLAFPKQTRGFISAFFATENFTPANEIKVEPTHGEAMPLAAVIDLAKAAVAPEEKFISIFIPNKSDQPYRLNFAPKNYQNGAPTITIFVDQYQQKIIEKRDPKTFKLGEKIISWQHAIHVGEGFTTIYTFIIFIVGFLPLLFSITGIALWLIKKSNKAKRYANPTG